MKKRVLSKGYAKGWSAERISQQAQLCRDRQPWQLSTGPKTTSGKGKSARNALKHGARSRVFTALTALLARAESGGKRHNAQDSRLDPR